MTLVLLIAACAHILRAASVVDTTDAYEVLLVRVFLGARIMLTVVIGVATVELVTLGTRAVLTMQFLDIELLCKAITTLVILGALRLLCATVVTIVFCAFHV